MLISILMPVHSGVEFISASVSSVEKQTHGKWELLIGVNGYPLDHPIFPRLSTLENRRVRVLHCSHAAGKCLALNRLASLAQGERCALLDVDDAWHSTKLAKQLPYLGEYDVVGTNCEYIGERSGSPTITLGEVPGTSLLVNNHIVNSSAVIRREDAHWDERWEGIEDYALWMRLAAAGSRFFNVPEVLCLHRVHAASSFNSQPQPVDELRNLWKERLNC